MPLAQDSLNLPGVTVYTDGACDPNPGTGGWAAILIHDDNPSHRKTLSGAEADSTNNRMELTACIEALAALKARCRVKLHTDSKYVKDAFTAGWIDNWEKRGWKTASRQPVKNQDLWKQLIEQVRRHAVEWTWVQGHAEDELNNLCDQLAVQARLDLVRAARSRG